MLTEPFRNTFIQRLSLRGLYLAERIQTPNTVLPGAVSVSGCARSHGQNLYTKTATEKTVPGMEHVHVVEIRTESRYNQNGQAPGPHGRGTVCVGADYNCSGECSREGGYRLGPHRLPDLWLSLTEAGG